MEAWIETNDWNEAAHYASGASLVLANERPPATVTLACPLVLWRELKLQAIAPSGVTSDASARAAARAAIGLSPNGHCVLMSASRHGATYATVFEAFREFSLPESRLIALLPDTGGESVSDFSQEVRLLAGGRADVALVGGRCTHGDLARLRCAADALLIAEVDASATAASLQACFDAWGAGRLVIAPDALPLPSYRGAVVPFASGDPMTIADAIRQSRDDRACFAPDTALVAFAEVFGATIVGPLLADELWVRAGAGPSMPLMPDTVAAMDACFGAARAAMASWEPGAPSQPPSKAPPMIPPVVTAAFRALPTNALSIQDEQGPVCLGEGWSGTGPDDVRWSGDRGLLWVRGAAGTRVSLRVAGPPSPPPGVLYPLPVYAVARWGPTEVVLYDAGETTIELVIPLAFADAWQPVFIAADRTIGGVGAGVVVAGQ
jgi:hypothetical protein